MMNAHWRIQLCKSTEMWTEVITSPPSPCSPQVVECMCRGSHTSWKTWSFFYKPSSTPVKLLESERESPENPVNNLDLFVFCKLFNLRSLHCFKMMYHAILQIARIFSEIQIYSEKKKFFAVANVWEENSDIVQWWFLQIMSVLVNCLLKIVGKLRCGGHQENSPGLNVWPLTCSVLVFLSSLCVVNA